MLSHQTASNNPRKPERVFQGTMSYENHVTMIIQGFTILAYAYAAVQLTETSLTMITLAAKNTPPVDYLSLIFNVYFGFITFSVVLVTARLLRDLFYYEITKEKLMQPLYGVHAMTEDGGCIRYVNNSKETPTTLAGFLFDSVLGTPNTESGSESVADQAHPKQPEPTKTATTTQQQTKSPATPDSARSNAETVTYDTPQMQDLKIIKKSGGEGEIVNEYD